MIPAMTWSSRLRLVPGLSILTAAVGFSACSTAAPDPVSSLTIATPTLATTIQADPIGIQYFIPRGSGRLSVPITVTSSRELPWAQLSVYLWDDGGSLGYCGVNLPDAPTWGPFNKGQTTSVTITGFQVHRVPCNVTSIRAWLHVRNNGTAPPPTASETVADGTLNVNFTVR